MPVWTTIILLLVILGVYSWQIEPRLLQIRYLSILDKRIKSPVRVAFLSDIHVTWFTTASILAGNIAKLKEVHQRQPFDFILLGGDFFDRNDRREQLLRWFCKEIVSFGIPVYSVFGNHDVKFKGVSNVKIRRIFDESSIHILENKAIVLRKGKAELQLVGLRELESGNEYLEGRYFIQGAKFYHRTLKNIDWYKEFDNTHPNLFRVAMSHNPDSVYLPGERRPDLLIAGHTHGGQIIFLTWLGLIFPQINPHGSFKSWSGVKRVGETTLAVSNGFGVGLMPFRFGSPPDAFIIDLKPVE